MCVQYPCDNGLEVNEAGYNSSPARVFAAQNECATITLRESHSEAGGIAGDFVVLVVAYGIVTSSEYDTPECLARAG